MYMEPRPRKPVIILEEIFNSVLHGIGTIATIAAALYISISFLPGKNILQSIGLYFFLATLTCMYMFSTLYHSLSFTKARKVFLVLDYGAIVLFIAGSYTAFIAATLQSRIGILFLVIVWIVSITIITLRSIYYKRYTKLFFGLYLLLGWFAVLLLKLTWDTLNAKTIIFVIIGGVCYTIGAMVLSMKKVPFTHTVWHALVIGGTTCHFIALTLI